MKVTVIKFFSLNGGTKSIKHHQIKGLLHGILNSNRRILSIKDVLMASCAFINSINIDRISATVRKLMEAQIFQGFSSSKRRSVSPQILVIP